MNIKFLVYGTTSILSTVLALAILGSAYNLLNKVSQDLVPTVEKAELQPLLNTYCVRDSDCKQYPKDCNQCVNILVGGITILNKCNDNPMQCACINNKCTIKN